MQWIAPSEKDISTDTLENRLWAAADQLRANSGLTSAQYSTPVLGLIFLRFADARFAKRRTTLEKTAASSRRGSRMDDPAAYHAEGVLYLAPNARFDKLLHLPEGSNAGKAINEAMRDIEKHNPQLAGVLPKTYEIFTGTLLKELLKRVSEIPATMDYDAFGLFVLEELDTGANPYLVAAAARAVRTFPRPTSALAPFVMRALTNIRYRDEPVSFDTYGAYAVSSTSTSPVRELLATLAWLGPHAQGMLPELELLRAQRGGISRKLQINLNRTVEAIRATDQVDDCSTDMCCMLPSDLGNTISWALSSRRSCEPIESTAFEDHSGELITFEEFFRGHPSIVVFFYTRCDNPRKCSLTVTKLARLQQLLESRGLADQIHTAAIIYDPAYDFPERIRGYGQHRGVRMNARHRMLRTTDGMDPLRRHFKLGVNFIESLVNWHRVEAYILDAQGRIAAPPPASAQRQRQSQCHRNPAAEAPPGQD